MSTIYGGEATWHHTLFEGHPIQIYESGRPDGYIGIWTKKDPSGSVMGETRLNALFAPVTIEQVKDNLLRYIMEGLL